MDAFRLHPAMHCFASLGAQLCIGQCKVLHSAVQCFASGGAKVGDPTLPERREGGVCRRM